MAKTLCQKEGLSWWHFNQPSREDIAHLQTLHAFHPLTIESLLSPTLHPALEDYEDHFFLILHFPIIRRDQARNAAAEVDFLVTQKALVTVTYQDFPRLEEILEKFRLQQPPFNQNLGENIGKTLYLIIDRLLGSLITDLDFFEEEVQRLEGLIFERPEENENVVEEICHARKDILDFQRITSPLQTVLKILPEKAAHFFGPKLKPYFIGLLTSESKIRHLIENHNQTIKVLHETNASLVSNRISRIITLLTIFSAVILPINFLASVWGMNQRFLPLRDNPYDFWIILGLMGAISTGLIIFFRKRRWF